MQNKTKKAKANRQAKVNFVVFSLFLACAVLFLPGCEETQRTKDTSEGKVVEAAKPVAMDDLTIQALRVIYNSLTDTDPYIRVNAIEVVAETRLAKLMPKVQRLMQDEFAPVRFAAALAVGDLEYSFGAEPVKQLFKDPDSSVKVAACYTMIRLGETRYIEVLRKAIESPDQTLRANTAFLLGKSDDKEAIKLLWLAMQANDSEYKVIYQAAESIAMLQDDRVYPKLWAMLISVYADVRVTGVRASMTRSLRFGLWPPSNSAGVKKPWENRKFSTFSSRI